MLRRLAAWWLTLFWFWLLLVGDWNRIEVIGAACGAAVGATIAEIVRGVARQLFGVAVELLRSLPATVCRAAGRSLGPPVRLLRGAHSGIIGEYLVWLALGAGVIGAVWAFTLT